MKDIRIAGLELKWFILVCIVIVAGCLLGAFPTGMVGAFLFLMVFGELLNIIGNNMPFAQISSRLGGAVIILLASFLVPIFFG